MSKYTKKYKVLAEKLSEIPEVTRYDKNEHKEAWTLAHAFLDLEESFDRFKEDYLLKLSEKDLSSQETYDLLLKIGEEFRHILYHIQDPKFYRYLIPSDEDSK